MLHSRLKYRQKEKIMGKFGISTVKSGYSRKKGFPKKKFLIEN
jgi:hypothetical protein